MSEQTQHFLLSYMAKNQTHAYRSTVDLHGLVLNQLSFRRPYFWAPGTEVWGGVVGGGWVLT